MIVVVGVVATKKIVLEVDQVIGADPDQHMKVSQCFIIFSIDSKHNYVFV